MKRFGLLIALIAFSAGFSSAQESGGAKGKIRASNGDGIAEALVTARQDGDDIKSVKTDAKGDFVLNGLRPGKYNFVFSHSGYSSGLLAGVEIESGKIRELGGRLILPVDRGTQVIINGSVYNQAGFAIYGAKVRIERILSDGSVKKVDKGYTSRNGEFTFRFPDSTAKFRITASAKGASESKDVEVEGAAIYRLAITLNLEK